MKYGEGFITLVRGAKGCGKTKFVSEMTKFIIEGDFDLENKKILICSPNLHSLE